jgi:hypothetical protein
MRYDNTKTDIQPDSSQVDQTEIFKSDRKRAVSRKTLQTLSYKEVKVNGGLWYDRVEANRKVTVPFVLEQCNGDRVSNFANAATRTGQRFKGIFYNDSDVYKAIEGVANSLSGDENKELETTVDGIIDKIAAAQWEDGYLFTYYSLPERKPDSRWTDLEFKHELYCAGHLIEAGLAYFRATGKEKLLNVSIKFADLICDTFGPSKLIGVPGHQEIEIALCMLYEHTQNPKYLETAGFFLSNRGSDDRKMRYGTYSQDHMPISEQVEAVGHTVRAGYMYCAAADVSRLTGSSEYIAALDKIWDDVVFRKMYLTGGVGAHRDQERYGLEYELPNDTAYCETCAALANIMWNGRMFKLKGDPKYIDVLERILYNNLLAGISLDGREFFYANPLESDGEYKFNKSTATRKGWFNCSCCPTNTVRFVPQVSGYIYAQDGNSLFVNLYIPSSSSFKLGDQEVGFELQTEYPRDGRVRCKVNPQDRSWFSVAFRIPGWSQGTPVPSDLYSYVNNETEKVSIAVNGDEIDFEIENGYAVLKRLWQAGDVVEIDIPMSIRKVRCNEKVESNRGKIAIERGPLVYCAEQIDNLAKLDGIAICDLAKYEIEYKPDMLGGISVISSFADKEKSKNRFIPYYSWSHRGEGAMRVWFNKA